MVYSQNAEYAGEAARLFTVMQRRSSRIGDLTFSDMRTTPALQAADYLSYELWRYYKNKHLRPDVPMRWGLKQILIQQWAFNHHFLKTLPRWYLKLQLSGFYVPVMTIVAIVVAIPAYFDMTLFARLNRAPVLPAPYPKLIRQANRREWWRRVLRRPGR
jgi:hypothetical protein